MSHKKILITFLLSFITLQTVFLADSSDPSEPAKLGPEYVDKSNETVIVTPGSAVPNEPLPV